MVCVLQASTQLGAPHAVHRLGQTFVPFPVFLEYIEGLATTTYAGAAYSLLEHNCNHFSEEVAGFLCGAHIPKHILHQPDLLPAPHRAALQHLLDSLVPRDDTQVHTSPTGRGTTCSTRSCYTLTRRHHPYPFEHILTQ